MTRCRVCGREFDPFRFQVVVPGLDQGFDRVECAQQARSLLGPAAASSAPLAAVVPPFPAAASPAETAAPLAAAAAAEAGRPLLVGANLALLAAGTAATVYLWFRVFGADPTAVDLSGANLAVAPAFERGSVPAQISTVRPSGPVGKVAPETPVSRRPAAARQCPAADRTCRSRPSAPGRAFHPAGT